MKNMFRMMGMFAALVGSVPQFGSGKGGSNYESPAEKEIREVCEWLKITERELYERSKQKPKLLSKYAKAILNQRYGNQ